MVQGLENLRVGYPKPETVKLQTASHIQETPEPRARSRALQGQFCREFGHSTPKTPEPYREINCLVLGREWGNGLWRLLLGII